MSGIQPWLAEEQIIGLGLVRLAGAIHDWLKAEATKALVAEGLHPLADHKTSDDEVPKCWARGEWKVFLDKAEDIQRAIAYVEENPLKEGKPPQRWSFVTPFDPATIV